MHVCQAEYQVRNPDSLIEGLHFYPFGGFKHTLEWVGLVGSGCFQMDQATGFTVDKTLRDTDGQ